MKMRDCFYGGRTEVFAAYADFEKMADYEFQYLDVCSLYPYVCSWKDLPIGVPTTLFGSKIEKVSYV